MAGLAGHLGAGPAGAVSWGTSVLCVTSPWYSLELPHRTVDSSIPRGQKIPRREEQKLQQASPNLRSQTASVPPCSISQASHWAAQTQGEGKQTLPLEGWKRLSAEGMQDGRNPSLEAAYHICLNEKQSDFIGPQN